MKVRRDNVQIKQHCRLNIAKKSSENWKTTMIDQLNTLLPR